MFFVSLFFFLFICTMDKYFEQLLSRVAAIYKKYGIKSVTMDDIARELGISKKTLYQYVANKKVLVEHAVNYEITYSNCQIEQIVGEGLNAIDELLAMNRHIIKMLKDHNPASKYDMRKYYPDLNEKIEKRKRQCMYDAIIKNIHKGQREGIFRQDLNSDIIARMQISRIENSEDNDLFSLDELVSPDFVVEMFMYHIRGLANRNGIDLLEKRLHETSREALLYGNPE